MKAHPAFAVVVTVPHYCVDTDGLQGSITYVASRHLTMAEAQAEADSLCGEECDAKAEMRPYREGEDDKSWHGYSLLELACHDAAQSNYSDEERYLDMCYSEMLANGGY